MTKSSWASFRNVILINKDTCDNIGDNPELFRITPDVLSVRATIASQITIISAYYDLEFLRHVFRKRALLNRKSVVMIFGRPASTAIGKQVDNIKEFKKELIKNGNVQASIAILFASDARFLHTKLYSFRKGRYIRALVGSANASSNGFKRNDEILIEIQGRSIGIENYINYVIKNSVDIEDIKSSDVVYSSFQSLLRDGLLYFRPTRSVPYTLDCFAHRQNIKEALNRSVLLGNPIPGHDEQSVGSLNILRLLEIMPVEKDNGDERVTLVPRSIETAFGYWVPFPYVDYLEAKIEISARNKIEQLYSIGRKLDEFDHDLLKKISRERYIYAIDERLASVGSEGLSEEHKREIEVRLIQKFEKVRKMLLDETVRLRIARPLEGTPIPEIWEDPYSRKELMDTFCEYVAWKLTASNSTPAILGAICNVFNIIVGDDAEEVRTKIDSLYGGSTELTRKMWDV